MGIPKFYRWLSERYPLLNQPITATEGPPDIDNLYLDMNGIIHNCTHANQREVKLREDDMMLRIFDYIDKLVQIIKPRKLLFMAIDGVAPRAKMNQQRSRRFKAAKERLEAQAELARKGEPVPDNPFDSNCITPGTGFMDRLSAHLRFFVRRKKSEDPLWQAPNVIFSGPDVPGEGEHKIMEYLRWEKRQAGYAPNQRHCLYGLDADLIMLSLVTHEPHFMLLREVVSYTGGNRGQPAREVLENPCAENFILFHIGLLREYLELEFLDVKTPFPIDVERVIDDFVLFCMLIGNDFLPPLPTLDIAEGALNAMMTHYKELLPSMGGYLVHAGELDRTRLEKFMARLGDMELEVLEERAKDAEYMEGKRAKRGGGGGGANHRAPAGPGQRSAAAPPANGSRGFGGGRGGGTAAAAATAAAFNALRVSSSSKPEDVVADIAAAAAASTPSSGGTPAGEEASSVAEPFLAPLAEDDPLLVALEPDTATEAESDSGAVAAASHVQAEPTMMAREARTFLLTGQGSRGLELWKDRWYGEKLGVGPARRRSVVEAYISGLHWVLEYYYRGVASWNWFYPHHYAPCASDFVSLDHITVKFTSGAPLRPFEQLLAVLPAASASLLPPVFQQLMLDPHSPIIDFYPTDFAVDMEGKRASWEGVVKIPFVEEERLLGCSRKVTEQQLSPEERSRNKLGQILVFVQQPDSKETEFCKATMSVFRDVDKPQSRCIKRPMPPPLPAGERGFVPQLVPGTGIGVQAPLGYPTLKTMQVRTSLRNAGVNVLGTPSRKESLILALKDLRAVLGGQTLTASQVAQVLVGARAYVNWPYLQEARIVRVSDIQEQWLDTGHSQPQQKRWQPHEAQKWAQDCGHMVNTLMTKHGLDVGKVDLVVAVRVCKGYVRHLDGTITKTYSQDEVTFPLQCIIRQRPQHAAAAGGDSAAAAQGAAADADGPREMVLKEGDRVVFLGRHHYGCVATVLKDLGSGLSKTGKSAKAPGAAAAAYRISVQPLGEGSVADPVQTIARRIVRSHEPRYIHSGEVARRIGANPRTLGRITGNVWVSEGEERYDVGLAVKAAGKGLCVPGYVKPTDDGNGWMYSDAMVAVLSDYKAQHPWVWAALESKAAAQGEGGPSSLRLSELLPGKTVDERKTAAAKVIKWVKSLPLASRPLVKSSVALLTEEGVRALQHALPLTKPPAPVEYEQVPPGLLLPPFRPGPDSVKVAVQGGEFELGDRVVSLLDKGAPAFGSHGTVIGVYDDAVEVLFDVEPSSTRAAAAASGSGGTGRGAYMQKDALLNTSRPVAVPMNKAAAPRLVGGAAEAGSSAAAASAAAGAQPGGSKQRAAPASARNAGQAPGASLQQVQARNGRPASAGPGATPAAGTALPAAPAAPPLPSSKLLGNALKAATQAASSLPAPARAAGPPAAPPAAPPPAPLPVHQAPQQHQQPVHFSGVAMAMPPHPGAMPPLPMYPTGLAMGAVPPGHMLPAYPQGYPVPVHMPVGPGGMQVLMRPAFPGQPHMVPMHGAGAVMMVPPPPPQQHQHGMRNGPPGTPPPPPQGRK